MTSDKQSFARLLTPGSVLRYLVWRLGGRRGSVRLRLAAGPVILLRPPGVGNNDYGVAYEIFVHRYYNCPRKLPEGDIRFVVDLGANVGFTCLHWLAQFPNAKVLAFEPHPGHFAQCKANLTANNLLARVELHRAAAGTAPRQIVLSDAGTSSAVVTDAPGIAASMLDIFDTIAGRHVDLLKLDIEGGEYPILADSRFALLLPTYLVMEWHGTSKDRDWCVSRLESLGYDVVHIFDSNANGMLWAFHQRVMQ